MKAFTAILALAAAANAHMIMKTPIPAGSPNSSPLSGSGTDFPCKTGPGKLDTSKPNVMSIGSSNTLSFTGSATHGGGSCQVSLAKGTDLSADTKWMVIHSIEGGCPAPNNGNQNLGNDPNGNGASQFQFTIPDHPDLGAGDYTLAWSWNNRIGNREFYMNCAYVQLTGATKKRYAPSKPAISKRQQAPLPDMFVANIGNGCSTPEGIDVEYPNPGSSLEIGPGANLGQPVGNCGSSGSAPANPGGNNPTTPSSSAAAGNPVVSQTAAPVAPSATGGYGGGRPSQPDNGQYTQTNTNAFATVAPGNPGATGTPDNGNGRPGNGAFTQSAPGVFITVSSSESAPAATATIAPSQPAPSAPAAPVGTGSPSTPSPAVNPPSEDPCAEGAWACAADGKSFQRCGSGAWSVPIQMAAGTSCTPGTGSSLAYNASGSNAKRDLKSHIARRRHNLHGAIFS